MSEILGHTFTGHISSLQEVDENEYSVESGLERNEKSNLSTSKIPPVQYHEIYLNELFGKEVADSFLHPVIDASMGVAGMSASLKSGKKRSNLGKKRVNITYEQTLSKLTNNAERLWKMLREKSASNIEQKDNKISPDLKQTFNSFAQSCLRKNMGIPQRGFVENKELNSMAKILNNKRIEKSNLERRKKQLMFNLSEVQESNQVMLMREKHLFGHANLEMGVKELFFPPLKSDSFTQFQDKSITVADNRHKTLSNHTERVSNEVDNFNVNRQVPYGLRFFTEEASLAILRGKTEIPDRNRKTDANDIGTENIIRSKKMLKEDRMDSAESYGYLMTRQKSVPIAKNNSIKEEKKQTKNHSGEFQPLTLNALMSFKVTKKPTFINDNDLYFRQGSVQLWRPKMTQS